MNKKDFRLRLMGLYKFTKCKTKIEKCEVVKTPETIL